jgi:hypothetical protein
VTWEIAPSKNTGLPARVPDPRATLPSTATAGSSPGGAGRSFARWRARRSSRSTGPGVRGTTGTGAPPRITSAANPQVARSRASASRSLSTRRKVRSLGTRYRPRDGSRRAPIRSRTSRDVPADHCQIAATELLPTTSVAHAARTSTTTSSCRRPRRLLRSGTCESLMNSDEAGEAGSDMSWVSWRARSASRSRAGLIEDRVDTSATPGMIFWRKHLKDHQESRSPVNPPPANTDQGRNQTSHSKDHNAGALTDTGRC